MLRLVNRWANNIWTDLHQGAEMGPVPYLDSRMLKNWIFAYYKWKIIALVVKLDLAMLYKQA